MTLNSRVWSQGITEDEVPEHPYPGVVLGQIVVELWRHLLYLEGESMGYTFMKVQEKRVKVHSLPIHTWHVHHTDIILRETGDKA